MTDQTPTPDTIVPAGSGATPPPAGEDYKKRFDGAILKIQELTLSRRDVDAELAKKVSEIEQLQAQLGLKDIEKTAAVGERDKQLQDAITVRQQQESELKQLRGLSLKIKIAKRLNRPDLLKIVDRIPDLEDEAVLETVMKDFAGFADDAALAREKQLMAGVTPAVGAGATAPNQPSTPEAWQENINNLPLGSKERAKALNDYGDWLENQHKPKS
jgi:hypothetical protein